MKNVKIKLSNKEIGMLLICLEHSKDGQSDEYIDEIDKLIHHLNSEWDNSIFDRGIC